MKIHKMFCVDQDINDRLSSLKGEASGIVNDLLRKYFEEKDFKNLTKEQIERKLAIIQIQKKHKEELEAFENG